MIDDNPTPNPVDNNNQPNSLPDFPATDNALNIPPQGEYPDTSAQNTPESPPQNTPESPPQNTPVQTAFLPSTPESLAPSTDAPPKPPLEEIIGRKWDGEAREEQDKKNREEQSRKQSHAQDTLNQVDFDRIERKDYEALEKVYVESAQFAQFYQDAQTRSARDYRMYFISGEGNSGRYATAIHLALKLTADTSQAPIYEYVIENSNTSLRLLDILLRATHKKSQSANGQPPDDKSKPPTRALPEGAIIIIRDMFNEAGGSIGELSDQYVRRLKHILTDSKLTLILTITHTAQEAALQKFILFSTMNEQGELYVDLGEIYTKFLDYQYPDLASFADDRQRLKDMQGQILNHLKRPREIHDFFDRAQSNIPQTADELASLLAQLVGEEKRRSQTRPWFESLSLNEKLYAMFVVLFRGLAQYDLDELYDLSTQHLRETMVDDYWLHDTRSMSAEKLQDVLLLKRRRDVLDFRVARPHEYIEEIERQIANHHRLLWSLSDLFVRLIKNSRPDDVQIRRLLATALGYIGEFRQNRLEAILDELAAQPEGYVASSVAFSLAHLARDVNHYPFIIKTLRQWIDRKDYDFLWAAIVSMAQTYDRMSQTAHAPASNTLSDNDKGYAQETLTQLRELLTEMCALTLEFDITELEALTRQTITEAILEVLHGLDPAERPPDDDIQDFINAETIKRTLARRVAISDQLGMSIIRTIQQISQQSPDDMVTLLHQWLSEKETSKFSWQLGRMASNFLFQQTTESGLRVVDERHLSLLKLLPALLDASANVEKDVHKILLSVILGETMSEEGIVQNTLHMLSLVAQTPINTVIQTLEVWYGYLQAMGELEDPVHNLWHDTIYPQLLHLVNVSGQHTRPMLVEALIQHWLNSGHEEVRRSAMALLTRCYVMDGVVLALPVHQYGAVLLDSGQLANELYRTWVFNLLQRLATLTPLRIYHLGWIGTWSEAIAHTHPSTPLHLGRFEDGVVDFGTITRDDLQLPIARPRLITPLIEAYHNKFVPFTAQEAHFILCLNLAPLDDMIEFVGDFMGKAPDSAADNIFLQALKPKQAVTQPDWAWFGKLFLLGNRPNDLRHLPEEAIHWLGGADELDEGVARHIEAVLQQRIIGTLHQTDDSVWLGQLRAYRHKEADIPLDFEALWAQLDKWVGQLDHVPEIIPPRDITLTITSAVLLWSKQAMSDATAKVCAWLTDDDPIIQHIGRACTKILFNFYRGAPYWDDVERLAPLLTLCVPFMKCQPKFAEILPILGTGLEWAKHKPWSDRLLINPDGGISDFIRAFTYLDDREDIDRVLNQLVIRETVLRIQSLFIDVGKPLDEFVALIKATIGWAIITQHQRQQALLQAQAPSGMSRRGRRSALRPSAQPAALVYLPITPPQGISPDFAQELLELPSLNEGFQRAILSEINKDQKKLLDKAYQRQHRDRRANIQAVIDSTRLQLYNKRTGELPPLPANTRYGVVLLDVSGRDQISRQAFPDYTIRLLNSLLKQTQTLGNKVLTLVHRLGRYEILTILEPTVRKTALRPEDIIPTGLPPYASLLAPILDRYPPHDTQFVAIITNKPAHDWVDIADNPAWTGRVFVISETNIALPMGIERIPMMSDNFQTDPFDTIAKDILNKTHKLRKL